MSLEKFPKCKGCKFFRVDDNPLSNHFGIPDTCEDCGRQSWEENPEQEMFFVCSPIQEWREKTKKQLRERFAFINEETHPIGTKSWLHEWRTLEKEVLEALG